MAISIITALKVSPTRLSKTTTRSKLPIAKIYSYWHADYSLMHDYILLYFASFLILAYYFINKFFSISLFIDFAV